MFSGSSQNADLTFKALNGLRSQCVKQGVTFCSSGQGSDVMTSRNVMMYCTGFSLIGCSRLCGALFYEGSQPPWIWNKACKASPLKKDFPQRQADAGFTTPCPSFRQGIDAGMRFCKGRQKCPAFGEKSPPRGDWEEPGGSHAPPGITWGAHAPKTLPQDMPLVLRIAFSCTFPINMIHVWGPVLYSLTDWYLENLLHTYMGHLYVLFSIFPKCGLK